MQEYRLTQLWKTLKICWRLEPGVVKLLEEWRCFLQLRVRGPFFCMNGEIKKEGIERNEQLHFFLVEVVNEYLFCFGFVSFRGWSRVSTLGGRYRGKESSNEQNKELRWRSWQRWQGCKRLHSWLGNGENSWSYLIKVGIYFVAFGLHNPYEQVVKSGIAFETLWSFLSSPVPTENAINGLDHWQNSVKAEGTRDLSELC